MGAVMEFFSVKMHIVILALSQIFMASCADSDACLDFTVSDCYLREDQVIRVELENQNETLGSKLWSVCEESCIEQNGGAHAGGDCLTWEVKCIEGLCNCTLFHSGFLHSCFVISGGPNIPIEECKDQN